MDIQVARFREVLDLMKPVIPRKTAIAALTNIMLKDGRAVGLCKYSPGLKSLDASVMDIKSATPVRLISLNEEEVTKVVPMIPGHMRIDMAAESPLLKGLGQGAVVGMGMPASHYILSEVPQEIVYKMIKAIATDWKTDMVPAYSELADWDVVKDTIRTVNGLPNPVPLHPGVAKYFMERGYEVPARILPPEWNK